MQICWLTLFLFSILAGPVEFCQMDTFNATCGPTAVIDIQSAMYGRMHIGRCVSTDYGHLGCEADVRTLTDRRCSGRHQCQIDIPDREFERTKPCPLEFKTFFEAEYTCVKGTYPDGNRKHFCLILAFSSQNRSQGFLRNFCLSCCVSIHATQSLLLASHFKSVSTKRWARVLPQWDTCSQEANSVIKVSPLQKILSKVEEYASKSISGVSAIGGHIESTFIVHWKINFLLGFAHCQVYFCQTWLASWTT